MTGVKWVHIPYKGAGPAMIEFFSGTFVLYFGNLPSVIQHARSGKLRGIAVTGAKRATPGYPTVAESGIPGFEVTTWYGVAAQAKAPRAIVDYFHREIVKALNRPGYAREACQPGGGPEWQHAGAGDGATGARDREVDQGHTRRRHQGAVTSTLENIMSVILGSGEHRYRVIENWAQLPPGWNFDDVGGVGVDSKDRVYVFNRGEHPMIVFDREGKFLRSWGEGLFKRAHGVLIDREDNMYLTDDGDHTMRKCTTDGKVLFTIGIPDKPAPYMSGEPFHRCTHTALSPKGELYISDGYGNARVHKYSPDGKLHVLLGRARHRPGAVQHRPQHRHRRRRLGVRGRSRESSRAGIRRQRQVRNAMEQSAPALRPVLPPGRRARNS